jgi:signal transduction histidine kinase
MDVAGRLTGFAEDGEGHLARRPDKDFRGWLWQDGRCADERAAPIVPPDECVKQSFFSVRLPIDLLRDDLYGNPHAVWPPPDLGEVRLHVRVLAPGDGVAVFDSDRGRTSRPFALSDLKAQLVPGEQLRIRRLDGGSPAEIIALTGEDVASQPSPLLSRIIQRLPVEGYDRAPSAHGTITTPAGAFDIELTGDVRGVDRSLAVVATQLSWFVGAMLAAIVLAWLAIEIGIIRRITGLTRRAASVRKSVHASEGLIEHDFQDLRSRDELGLLAGVLGDLLQRLNEDVKRERIRTEQEKDMWHAVGHEILAPLQSLMALHPAPDDPNRRYIERMQRAVRVLYGTASPGEAILSATLQVSTLDISGFLTRLAENAAHAGIPAVHFAAADGPVIVKADEHSLEDVIAHVLSNADRYRPPGTSIELTLSAAGSSATVGIRNQGPPIDPALLGRIFEYGVSDAVDSGAHGNRGQGLFVAKTYMAKMGGTIEAHNVEGGVEFVLTLASA